MTLIDTDVLIEILKGHRALLESVSGFDQCALSTISVMELVFGARNKEEVRRIDTALASLTVYHLSEPISEQALFLMRNYTKSHGLAIPDALIAATAIVKNTDLCTLNVKDFRFIEGLNLVH